MTDDDQHNWWMALGDGPEIRDTITRSVCPACSHDHLRLEDANSGRHQCCRCGWRCLVDPDTGAARDWLPAWRRG